MGESKRHLAQRDASSAPRAPGAFAGGIRPFADRMFHFGVSEFSLVVLLGVAWINPAFVEAIRPGFIAALPLLFVAEFILGHASVGFAVTMLFEGVGRLLFSAFIVAIYAMFFVALFRFGHAVQVAFFLWITLGRLYRAEVDFRQTGGRRADRESLVARLAVPSMLRFGVLLLCLLLSQVLPLPRLGLAQYAGPTLGSGSLVDHPESAVFLLMLYFASISWLERHVFPTVTRVFVH